MVFGGALFGAFVEGLVFQVHRNFPEVVVLWALSGIVGAGLIAWSLAAGRI